MDVYPILILFSLHAPVNVFHVVRTIHNLSVKLRYLDHLRNEGRQRLHA